MQSGLLGGFVALPMLVLLGVAAAFLLVVSPALPVSLPSQLVVLLVALAAAKFPKVHALGLSLIGLPAVTALLLTEGDAAMRSGAALLAMLEFYALEQIFWGLSEDIPQPWWMLGLVWLWMPSVLGLLGMALLFVVCHQRWHLGLASVRHTQKHSAAQGWGAVGAVLLLVMGVSLWLGLPKPEALTLPDLPNLRLQNATPAVFPEPNTAAGAALSEPVRPISTGLPHIGGSEFVAFLVLVYLYFAWQRLQLRRPVGKGRSAKGGLWLGLVLLSGVVGLMVLFGLNQPNPERQSLLLPLDSSFGVWAALALFLLFFVAWRIHQARQKRGEVKLEAGELGLQLLRHIAPDDAVRAAYYRWLLWLRDVELRRSPTQTPSEFAQMVGVQHPTMHPHSQTLTNAYERVRYGSIPSQGELEQVLYALEQWRLELGRLLPEGVSLLEVGGMTLNAAEDRGVKFSP
jgi:hypothetical protein